MIQCQVANVTIESEGSVARLEVPAFTREADNFAIYIASALNDYHEISKSAGRGMSTADFAMYLLALATSEPREQEVDG